MENYLMSCRLIEGRYPNYNSVIPKNNPHRATADRLALLGAMKRVANVMPAWWRWSVTKRVTT